MNDDEDRVIARIDAASRVYLEGAVGIGDDAAIVDGTTVVTVDTMVEGVHWDDRLSPADVGWKLVAVNLSDLAAMGASPRWAVLALTLPEPLDLDWVDGFVDGLSAACRHWGLSLVGGDTTRGPGRVASLTVGGHAPHPVRRTGARPGDDVWVTGTLGRSAEAFLADVPRGDAVDWLRRPRPDLAFPYQLAGAGLVHAMMDLSDGLLRDLGRLCTASGVGAVIDTAVLPGDVPVAWRVAFGEDYELVFTSPPDASDRVESLAAACGVAAHRVGVIVEERGVRRADGESWPEPLFAHFRSTRGPP